MWQAGEKWEGDNVMRCYLYLITMGMQTVDAVFLAYTWSLGAIDPADVRSSNDGHGYYNQWSSNAVKSPEE